MLRGLLPALALLAMSAGPASAGQWLAGDLHVHTTYSHDSWGGPGDDEPTDPQDYYTFGQTVTEDFLVAKSRGLDYLAITDHNDVRSQADAGFGFGGVLPVPAYENSLHGHGQMLGATRVYDSGNDTWQEVRAMERALHADGGLLQANHPTDPVWGYDYAAVPVDTVEVWNLPWFYGPPFPASGDHDAALRFGEAMLDRGAHIGFTGGSDSHWKSTIAGQGPGQPTTWVHASESSVKGVLAGLRGHHTFVSSQPPNMGGAKVFLEGKVAGAWTAMQGDTVAPGTALRVRVQGAPGATVRIVGDHGTEVLSAAITGDDFTAEATPGAALTWAYAQVYGEDRPAERQQICRAIPVIELDGQTVYCHNRIAMLALTSPIYLAPPRILPLDQQTDG
jgi:hypothetical protein